MFKLLFRLKKWRITHYLPSDIKKCIIVAAPHTSNWDFVYGVAAMQLMKLSVRFAIKKEWVQFPLKRLMLSIGAVPIDRSRNPDGTKRKTVDAIAEIFNTHDELHLMIPPEGTRSKVEKWKTGFYYAAYNAKVPIALGFLDYGTRTCGIKKIIYPTGDYKTDMKEMMDVYINVKGKNPENFSVDLELYNNKG